MSGSARSRHLPILLLLLAGLAAIAGCDGERPSGGVERPTEPAPPPARSGPVGERILGLVPAFRLTDQTGAAFGTSELRGSIWLAELRPAGCAAPCALRAEALRSLQDALPGEPPRHPMWIVSVRLDGGDEGEEGRPSAAEELGADGERWTSIAGAAEELAPLLTGAFGLPVGGPETARQLRESGAGLVLVDPYLRVRGRYAVERPEELERLREDLAAVAAERVGIPSWKEVFDPPWLEARGRAQVEAAQGLGVRHDFRFEDVREQSGIDFRNRVVDDAARTYKPVHYDHGNGLAVADVDGDGRLDLYFVTQVGGNELWRNLGEGRFENLSDETLAVADAIGVSASFADIDNDGDPDLYVTTVRGGNRLLRNDGSGRFSDISAGSGVDHVGHSSAAVFLDYDRDALLDLYLTNVGKYTSEEIRRVTPEQVRGDDEAEVHEFHDGFADAFAGHLKPEERDESSLLFRNLGGGRFEDVTERVGLVDHSWSGAASPVDFNGDGWPDLYLLDMQGDDEYHVNVGGERFERRSREHFPRTSWGSMGVKSFDHDNDGDMDLFVTDMHSDMSVGVGPEAEKLKADMQWPESMLQTGGRSLFGNSFFRNDGEGRFVEVSDAIGAETYWPWGLSVGDLNADGWDDVFVTGSMNFPYRYAVNSVLLNDRGKRFVDSEFTLGVEPRQGDLSAPWFEVDCDGADEEELACHERSGRIAVWSVLGSRSSAIFDMDGDGDLDIVTNEHHERPMLLRSDLAQRAQPPSYLALRLVGTKSNRDGLGTVVRLRSGGRTYLKVHDGQSGYLSQSLLPLYFGLGEASVVDAIELTWPSGTVQLVEGPIQAGRTLEVAEE